jgi:hypothetical protein
MTPESLHDMFFAAAGVAGALIGLLFVAISIEHDRLIGPDADQVHRVRARSALSAFTNALVVSLFALTTGRGLAISAVWVGTVGILFVAASVLSVRRLHLRREGRTGSVRNLTFLIAILVTFGLQILWGIVLIIHPHDASTADNLSILVIVSCLLGIFRAWELIGGPEVGFSQEVRALVHEHRGEEARGSE